MVRTQLIFTLAFLAGFVGFLTPVAFAQPQEKENAKAWAKAEAKIEEHFKAIDPKLRAVELKSERLSKYLPKFRAFVAFDQKTIGEPVLFLVNQEAEITDFRGEVWRVDPKKKYARVPRIAEFLGDQELKVKTPEDAIELFKFIEGLQEAHSFVAALDVNTKDFSGFDKRCIEGHYSPSTEWKYISEKREWGWMVTYRYFGEGSIMTPHIYEMEIDDEGNFCELKRLEKKGL